MEETGDHGAAIAKAGCPMSLDTSITEILTLDLPAAFERFGETLDPQWVEEALQQTGTATIRRRKLTTETIVWLVIGMALFRDRSIQEVVSHLGLAWPAQKEGTTKGSKKVAPSAIPQGRYRVGAAPIELIFSRTAERWGLAAANASRWRGLSLFGVDGTTLRIQDTESNREAFGLPPSGRAQSGYPQVRLVALMALRSHMIVGASFGPCRGKQTGEQTLAKELWPQVPEQSLVINDRGFLDYGQFYSLSHESSYSVSGKRHWLVRAKKNLRWKTLKVLGEGDDLVELNISSAARKRNPDLPTKMVARAIRYQIKGCRPQTLLTSLVDAEQYPALEVAELYHERWEIELGYDELKTHMLERQEALRSKKPEGVRQEIWGILLTYNLVRKEMLQVAVAAGVDPLRVSFRHCLQLIRVFCMVEAWTCAPGNIPKRLSSHLEMMESLLILPPRRSEREYERHVKIKMSGYKRNPGRPESKRSQSHGKSAN